jgi:hypothetical protein
VAKSRLPMAMCCFLATICELVALAKDAPMLVQILLAWAVCVLASGLTGQRPPWSTVKEPGRDDA